MLWVRRAKTLYTNARFVQTTLEHHQHVVGLGVDLLQRDVPAPVGVQVPPDPGHVQLAHSAKAMSEFILGAHHGRPVASETAPQVAAAGTGAAAVAMLTSRAQRSRQR